MSITDKRQAFITKYGNIPDTFSPSLDQISSNINYYRQDSRLAHSINPWDGGFDE